MATHFEIDTYAERVISSLRIVATGSAVVTGMLYRRTPSEGWFPAPNITTPNLPLAIEAGTTDAFLDIPVYGRYLDLLGEGMENISAVAVNTNGPSASAGITLNVSKKPGAAYSEIQEAVNAILSTGGTILVDETTYDNPYAGFTIAGDNISVIGIGSPSYDHTSETFGKCAIIKDEQILCTGKNVRLENLAVHSTVSDCIVATNDIDIVNCIAKGLDSSSSQHCFLLGNGVTRATIKDCQAYYHVHGFAIRASGVQCSNLLAVDNGFDGIIIKADGGENNKDILIDNVDCKIEHGSMLTGIYVQMTTTGTLKDVVISNFKVEGTNVGVVVENASGDISKLDSIAISDGVVRGMPYWGVSLYYVHNVTVNGVHAIETQIGFLTDHCQNIAYGACVATGNDYGFYNQAGSSTLVYIFGAATAGNVVESSGTFAYSNFNGVIVSQNILSQNLTVGVDLEVNRDAYFRRHSYLLNKAETGWIATHTRNTAGSEAVLNLAGIGTLAMSGALTVGGDATVSGLLTAASLTTTGTTIVNAPQIRKVGISDGGYASISDVYASAAATPATLVRLGGLVGNFTAGVKSEFGVSTDGTDFVIYVGGVQYRQTSTLALFSTDVELADAKNLKLNTTTGTKIGTATSQKLGFWNATPVVQQVLATGASRTVDDVIGMLQTVGLCKQS